MQIVILSQEIREASLARVQMSELKQVLSKIQYHTLREDGLIKAAEGLTVKEVIGLIKKQYNISYLRNNRVLTILKHLRGFPASVCMIASTGKLRLLCSVFFLLFLCTCATTSFENMKEAEARYKIGHAYLLKDRLKESFIEFQKAIRLNPKDKRSLNMLGYISMRFKEYDEALSYYKRAIAIDPDYSEAMNNLGVTYMETENWDEAIKYFELALKNLLYRTPEKAYSNMGFAFYKKAEYPDAMKTLNKAVIKYPDFHQTFYIRGLVHMKVDNVDSAITDFKKTVNIAPKHINAHWELAHAYLRVGNTKEAVKHFSAVAENDDNKKGKEALNYLELLEK